MKNISPGARVRMVAAHPDPRIAQWIKEGMTGTVAHVVKDDDPPGGDEGYAIDFDHDGKRWYVPQEAVHLFDAAESRALMVANARGLRAEIQQIFTDIASWNDNSRARKEGAAAIDPDPDGQLRRMADGLDKFLAAEDAR